MHFNHQIANNGLLHWMGYLKYASGFCELIRFCNFQKKKKSTNENQIQEKINRKFTIAFASRGLGRQMESENDIGDIYDWGWVVSSQLFIM